MNLQAALEEYARTHTKSDCDRFFGRQRWSPKRATVEDAQRILELTESAKNDALGESYVPVGEGRNVMLLLPQYKQTNPATLFSILGLWDKRSMRCVMHYGDAYVVHTRNKLAHAFLQSGCEWSLWIDDDMVCPIGDPAWFNSVTGLDLPPEFAGRHTLARLMSHGVSLVGALYFGRQPKGKPMFAEGMHRPDFARKIRDDKPQALTPTQWVGTGCLLVHRRVFTDIQAKCPFLAPRNEGGVWEFFSPMPDDVITETANAAMQGRPQTVEELQTLVAKAMEYRPGVGEDVIFCRRALAAGHQPHVDLGLVAGHVGGCVYGPKNTNG